MPNIYVRYFDHEAIAHNIEELLDFLGGISEINITPDVADDIACYIGGDMPYPKRYKVRPRVYFILIKTQASTLEEFKSHRFEQMPRSNEENEAYARKEQRQRALCEEHYGWYRCTLLFKRVLMVPGTGKYKYTDTRFSAFVKAQNALACYDRIVEYLKSRHDIDPRCQYPSVKGDNFQFEFMGEQLQQEAIDDAQQALQDAPTPENYDEAVAQIDDDNAPAAPEVEEVTAADDFDYNNDLNFDDIKL